MGLLKNKLLVHRQSKLFTPLLDHLKHKDKYLKINKKINKKFFSTNLIITIIKYI